MCTIQNMMCSRYICMCILRLAVLIHIKDFNISSYLILIICFFLKSEISKMKSLFQVSNGNIQYICHVKLIQAGHHQTFECEKWKWKWNLIYLRLICCYLCFILYHTYSISISYYLYLPMVHCCFYLLPSVLLFSNSPIC